MTNTLLLGPMCKCELDVYVNRAQRIYQNEWSDEDTADLLDNLHLPPRLHLIGTTGLAVLAVQDYRKENP